MDEGSVRDKIARLEEEIERLAASMQTARKIILASKAAIAVGAVLGLALLTGAIGAKPLAIVAAITATLGGIVGFGSNVSTLRQERAALLAAEAERTELIGSLELREVGARLHGPPSP